MATLDLLPAVEGLTFDEADHRYEFPHPTLGRLPVVSATTAMAATGAKVFDNSPWRRKLMRKEGMTLEEANAFMEAHRNKRAQIGTDFHELVRCHLLGLVPRVVEEESTLMFGRWREDFLPRLGRVRLIEAPLVHRSCFYAGTPDLLAEVDGVPCLIDWKTQQVGQEKARPEWQLQGGSYWELIRRCHRITPGRALNLIVTATRVREKWWNLADLKQGWLRFASYLADYHEDQAAQGSVAHALAFQAMEPMF
jgi:hypothetical protein